MLTIKGPRDPGNIAGLGSHDKPVRLDPWTNIVEVGWNAGWGSIDLASIDGTDLSPVNTPEGPVTGAEGFADINPMTLSVWFYQTPAAYAAGLNGGALQLNTQNYDPINFFGTRLQANPTTINLDSENHVLDSGHYEAAQFTVLTGAPNVPPIGWNNLLFSAQWELGVGNFLKPVQWSAALCNRDLGPAGDYSIMVPNATMNVYHNIPAQFSQPGWVISGGGDPGMNYFTGPQVLPGFYDFTVASNRRLFNDVIGTTGKLGAKSPLKSPTLAPLFFFRGDTKGGKSDPLSMFAKNRVTGNPWTVAPGTVLVGGPTLPTVPGFA